MGDWTAGAQTGLNLIGQLVRQKKSNYTHSRGDLSRREKLGVLMAKASYQAPQERPRKIKGYVYQPSLSNEKHAVYKHRKGRYQVAIRGTVPMSGLGLREGDIGQDIEIMKGSFGKNSAQVQDAQKTVDEILRRDPKAKSNIALNGHSLGARIALEVLHDPKNKDTFHSSVALSPGFSPLGSREDQARQEKLVSSKKHKNFVLGVANDAVWSGNKAMHKGHSNVKILPAVSGQLTKTHTNHFLTAYDDQGGPSLHNPHNYWHQKKNDKI